MSDSSAVRPRGEGREGRDPEGGKRASPATFYRQVVAELRKVVYPTQQQLITYFFVVMIFVVVMIGIVSVLDLAFGRLVFALFTNGTTQ